MLLIAQETASDLAQHIADMPNRMEATVGVATSLEKIAHLLHHIIGRLDLLEGEKQLQQEKASGVRVDGSSIFPVPDTDAMDALETKLGEPDYYDSMVYDFKNSNTTNDLHFIYFATSLNFFHFLDSLFCPICGLKPKRVCVGYSGNVYFSEIIQKVHLEARLFGEKNLYHHQIGFGNQR